MLKITAVVKCGGNRLIVGYRVLGLINCDAIVAKVSPLFNKEM